MAHTAVATQSCLQCRWQRLTVPQTKLQPPTPLMQRQMARLRQLSDSAAVRRGADDLRTSQPAPIERNVEQTDAGEAAELTDEKTETLGVRFMLLLVAIYKQGISPLLPGSCRYIPTCSTFAAEAFEQHGVFRGCVLTALRIARCNPLGSSGYDPVPKEWPYQWL